MNLKMFAEPVTHRYPTESQPAAAAESFGLADIIKALDFVIAEIFVSKYPWTANSCFAAIMRRLLVLFCCTLVFFLRVFLVPSIVGSCFS